MPDLFHQYGGDLLLGPSGDLASVDATLLGQQRVLRRLLTNPGDYLWNPAYGAGLGQFVGQPASVARIRSAIRSHGTELMVRSLRSLTGPPRSGRVRPTARGLR